MGIINMKYSDEEVRNIMRNEGLEYAVFHFMELDGIENDELQRLCKEMRDSRDKVEQFMIKKFGENWQKWNTEG